MCTHATLVRPRAVVARLASSCVMVDATSWLAKLRILIVDCDLLISFLILQCLPHQRLVVRILMIQRFCEFAVAASDSISVDVDRLRHLSST